jgi:hypothetical protein
LCLLALVCGLSSAANRQNQSRAISGDYGELLLGVDNNGVVTGYYSSSTGARQEFSCIFYLRGKLQGDTADIVTWFPEDKERIRGRLRFVDEHGKPSVNVKLESEHGGCWNVNSAFDEEGGSTLALDKRGNWLSVRVVSADRAYFHNSPNTRTKRKVYIVTGDGVRIFKAQNGWVEAEFHGNCIDVGCEKRKITRGWLKESDLFSSEPGISMQGDGEKWPGIRKS